MTNDMSLGASGSVLALIALVPVIALSGCVSEEPGTLKSDLVIPGTGACESILNELADEFNGMGHGFEVIIPESTGSSGGVRSAGEGGAVLGRVARKVKEEESGYGLSYMPFARDKVVFAVSGDVNVTGLTTEQLLGMFSGNITKWSEVGGSDNYINLFVREEGDSSLSVIQDNMRGFSEIEFGESARVMYHDYEMLEVLDKYQNAIGFLTGSSMIGTDIKALAVDGIEPATGNIVSGDYALVSEYAFVYKESSITPEAQEFIDFVDSGTGSQILETSGLIPV